MCKKEDVCWRGGQNAENKQKTKNQSVASERQLVQIQSIRREEGGWMQLLSRLAPTQRPDASPLPGRRSGADQLRLYYTSEMDNLVLLACHFNGPLTVAAPRPPANPRGAAAPF